jgi:hypothetical protein
MNDPNLKEPGTLNPEPGTQNFEAIFAEAL